MKDIILFDPSIRNNHGDCSINLGDVIIYKSVEHVLEEILPDFKIKRISTHVEPDFKLRGLLKHADYIFVGGSNLLSSNIPNYNQWKLSNHRYYYLLPYVRNAILLGVGWWQYQHMPTLVTKYFYRKVLHPKIYHSVRDNYTVSMLKYIIKNRVINTCCPTVWGLDGQPSDRNDFDTKDCVFTLTDYAKNAELDEKVIELLLACFSGKLLFFPQGTGDFPYLQHLECYKKNKDKFFIIKRTVDDLATIAKNKDICYVGTRLHGGIYCKQFGVDSLILAVDNRAQEIKKDTNFPVIQRNDLKSIQLWLEGRSNFGKVSLPVEEIIAWKNQFE